MKADLVKLLKVRYVSFFSETLLMSAEMTSLQTTIASLNKKLEKPGDSSHWKLHVNHP